MSRRNRRSSVLFRTRTFIALGATMGAIVACSETSFPGTPPDVTGQFTATVSGVVTAQLSGTATSQGLATGTPGWNVDMTTADGLGGIGLIVEGMARPGPDNYEIASALEHGGNAPGNDVFTAILGLATPSPASFGSISGSLTITDSSPTSVTGTFGFVAEDPQDETRTITVQGSFISANRDL